MAFSLVILPSKTNSQSAGTSKSTVLHFTKSVFSRTFAILNSSAPIGRVVAAESRVAVELPRQIAMSNSPPALANAVSVPRCSTMRATKWFLSLSINRWKHMLRLPVSGSLTMEMAEAMYFPPSLSV